MEAELRADISDSTITYFLLTGDEDANLTELKSLLDDKKIPTPMDPRDYVRFEAENFLALENFEVEHRNDRRASQRLSVRLTSSGRGTIRTPFNQPYTAESACYDVDVRYFDAKAGPSRLALLVNGSRQGDSWGASKNNDQWTTQTVPDVTVKSGDEITVAARGEGGRYAKLDYVQFNRKDATPDSSAGTLDDRAALPGQVIVAGSNPGYLKYNGGGPVFLCGPDNPEDFLFRGKLNPDGTRSGGGQQEAINRFMEQTDFHKMKSRDDLAAGSTKWVLANPGSSYIAYTYDYSGKMGVEGMTAGKYNFMWFDTIDGDTVTQTDVSVSSDNVTWSKPDSMGSEVALYIKRSR